MCGRFWGLVLERVFLKGLDEWRVICLQACDRHLAENGIEQNTDRINDEISIIAVQRSINSL